VWATEMDVRRETVSPPFIDRSRPDNSTSRPAMRAGGNLLVGLENLRGL